MRYYLFFICFTLSVCVFGQETMDMETLKQKTFGKLNKSRIYDGILINASVLPVDLDNFSANSQFEANYDTWIKMYYKIYSAHLEQPKIPTAEEIYTKAEEYNKKGIIPLGICHFNYSAIRADAIDRGLLRLKDDVLYESSSSREDPYELKECIAFAPFSWRDNDAGNFTFMLSNEFIFDNTDSKISSISVDFADGTGFRKIRINEPVNVVYGSSGLKTIRMNLNIGGKKYSLKSTMQIGDDGQKSGSSGGKDLGSEVTPNYTESIQITHNGNTIKGEWGVYYGCDNVLNKPVIVIEGFDPLNSKKLAPIKIFGPNGQINNTHKKNLYAINDTEQHTLDKLRELGYDIIILDFEDNPIDLRASGRLVAELIKTINNRKVGNNELIVMGRSGGGLLARYALVYLENNNINHQTRLLLTNDSPHQGANIPLGFQHFLDFATDQALIMSMLGTPGTILKDVLFDKTINSTYAKQLLYYHYTATSGSSAYPSALKNSFFNDLNSLGNYPTKLIKVAISSGNRNAGSQGVGFNQNLLAWDAADILPTYCANVRVSSYVKTLPQKGSSGYVMGASLETRLVILPCVAYSPWVTLASAGHQVNNVLPYDDAPGGSTGWHRFDTDAFMPDALNNVVSAFTGISIEQDPTCFVPVISAIDLNSSILPTTNGGLFYNVNSSLANNPNIVKVGNIFYNLSPPNVSPFDIMYVSPANLEHGESNSEWTALFDNAVTPINLSLQNQQITTKRTYHARNNIASGNNVTSTIPQGDFVVKSGSKVEMTAGNKIVLSYGFKTEPGAEFKATIHNEVNCQINTKSFNVENRDDYDETDANTAENSIFEIITSTENPVTVAPVPADSRIVVSFNRYSETDIVIEIYNIEGTMVYSNNNANRITEINVANYMTGNYIVKITANNQVFTQKFIKQ